MMAEKHRTRLMHGKTYLIDKNIVDDTVQDIEYITEHTERSALSENERSEGAEYRVLVVPSV
jgi:hypothetical protein